MRCLFPLVFLVNTEHFSTVVTLFVHVFLNIFFNFEVTWLYKYLFRQKVNRRLVNSPVVIQLHDCKKSFFLLYKPHTKLEIMTSLGFSTFNYQTRQTFLKILRTFFLNTNLKQFMTLRTSRRMTDFFQLKLIFYFILFWKTISLLFSNLVQKRLLYPLTLN